MRATIIRILLHCLWRLSVIGMISSLPLFGQTVQWTVQEVGWTGLFPEVGVSEAEIGPGGRIWMATEGAGLWVWDGVELRSISAFQGHFVTDIQFFEDHLYLATDQGGFRYQLFPGTFDSLDLPLEFPGFFVVHNGKLMALSHAHGLFELSSDQWSRLGDAPASANLKGLHSVNQELLLASDQGTYVWRDRWIDRPTNSAQTNQGAEHLPAEWNEADGFILQAQGHAWKINSKGIQHAYPIPIKEKFFEEIAPGAQLLLREGSVVLFSQQGWKDAQGNFLALPDVGLVLDVQWDTQLSSWWLATETGLYRMDDKGLQSISLPLTDPFVFSIHFQQDYKWLGTGEALLMHDQQTNEWKRLPYAGVNDLYATDSALWFSNLLGEYFRLDIQHLSVDTLHPSATPNWLGFLAIDGQVGLLADNGQWHALQQGGAIKNIVKAEEAGRIKQWQADAQHLALEFSDGWALYDLPSLDPLTFLHRGVDFPNGISSLLWVNSQSLALLENDGWSIRALADLVHHLPSPEYGVLEVAQSAKELPENKGFQLEFSHFQLPYYSSFLRLKPYLRAQEDRRKWGIGYELWFNGQLSAQENNVFEVLFPALSPGHYQLHLFVVEPHTSRRSSLKSLEFSVIPPIWQQPLFLIAVVLLLGAVAFFFIRTRIQRLKEESRLQTELSRLEGMALRLQMNPHFIFNALDSISSFIFRNQKDEAVHYLSSFARLIRNTLESAHEHLIPLRNEIDILRSYLELERMRSSERLVFLIDCNELLQEQYMVPPLVIQPYVENAVKHGLKPRKGAGHVWVRFAVVGKVLQVEVEDDGIGRAASGELKQKSQGMLKGKSMSMGITQQRLLLLNKTLSEEVRVEIIDKQDSDHQALGTLVRLYLPLIEDEWDDAE